MIKAFLIQLATNMWDEDYPPWLDTVKPEDCISSGLPLYHRLPDYWRGRAWSDVLKCEIPVWRRVTERFAAAGGNMLVIDLGDGIVWRSHPEIAVGRAWSLRTLKDELARCRDLGLEVIPKLNFSACHDGWMRLWSRRVATPEYYRFCRDLIEEAQELFGGARFFHIGMDEEEYRGDNPDRPDRFVILRQGKFWYDDLHFYCDEVRRAGARPWMWADKLWNTADEEYRKNVPADAIQSNWYYHEIYDYSGDLAEHRWRKRLDAFLRLEKLGFDQIPAASNWAYLDNYRDLTAFCERHLKKKSLLGYMQTVWYPTDRGSEAVLLEACACTEEAKKADEVVLR